MSTLPFTIPSADPAVFETVVDILRPKLTLGAKRFAMSARSVPTSIGVAADLGTKARPPLFHLSHDRSRPAFARGRGRAPIR